MRGLPTAITTLLGQQSFSFETLVQIFYTSGLVRYTTGFSEVTIGAATYTPNNGLTVVGNLVESYILGQSEFSIQLETADTNLVNLLSANRNSIKVTATRMFRDVTTNVPDTVNLLPLYDSLIDDFVVQGGLNMMTVSMKSRPVFGALDRIRTRTNADVEPQTNVQLAWGSFQ